MIELGGMSGNGGGGGDFLQTGGGKIGRFVVENFVVMFVSIRSGRRSSGEKVFLHLVRTRSKTLNRGQGDFRASG
jgi:hypothetical protein